MFPRKLEEVNSRQKRLKVPFGWIVYASNCGSDAGVHQIFIFDPFHWWKLEFGKSYSTRNDED